MKTQFEILIYFAVLTSQECRAIVFREMSVTNMDNLLSYRSILVNLPGINYGYLVLLKLLEISGCIESGKVDSS